MFLFQYLNLSFVSLILLPLSALIAATSTNQDEKGIAVKGYDVVSYFKASSPLKGDARYTVKHPDGIFLFSSEENKKEFLAKPAQYLPQYGGWCAYAVADSKSKVDIDPLSFLIQDGRLLLFYNGFWGDTRKKWQASPAQLIKQADQHWPAID